MSPARARVFTVSAGAIIGAVLFAWAVRRVGVDAIIDAVRRVGWGILAILALGGLRLMLRALCWQWCLPRGVQLDYPHAFSAFLAGDAVGNVTPLGMLASEPTKVLLTRHHLATIESVASLTVENILYSISVVAMLAFGFTLLLATVAVPETVRWAGVVALAAVCGGALVARRVLRASARTGRQGGAGWGARLVRLREEVGGFAREHPGRVAGVLSLQMLFHALAVIETYITLQWLLGERSPTAIQAILFETVNRFTIVAFKFVPFRIGVDEALSATVAPLLAATAAAGVALAVIRKARVLFWSGIGLLLVATHPASR